MKKVAIPMEELMPILLMQMETAGSALLHVTGYSMMPMLHHRKDTVRLKQVDAPLKKGDLILYQRENGAYILHRILRSTGRSLVCCGDNQCRTERIRSDQVLAVVTEFTRNGKHYTTEHHGYLRYVRLWVALHPLRWLYLGPRRALGMVRAAMRHHRYKKNQQTKLR